ncbi:hypothetical protein [Enterobacter cancerogenus]|uniref:hypothetical protein n=1 Tax=Enterobacter cancerogenus TaxID=69218 RepID=UPI00129988E8|nr:hypothetical protein [Enterobacter cancerogenus]MRG31671.1 hypothetical protein [Enterobacter cancerogenus]
MKLFEMEGFLRGKCLPGDMKVNETNAEYLVRKFSELEQRLIESERYVRQTDITIDNLEMKLAQMAAENAELISSSECLLHEASEVYRAYNKTQLPDGGLVDEQCLQMVYDAINATPTTGDFLAEVRAQGVEQLSSLAGNECQRYKSVNDRAGVRKWKSIVILCSDFAAQLRKGVQS